MSAAMRFFIYSAGYNCADAAETCIRSIQTQTFKNYVHVIVDDASTDQTWERIAQLKDERTIAHRNAVNRKWLANAFEWLKPNDEDIVAVVDLDDWLAVPDALERVAELYRRDQCWLTYGNYCLASSLPKSKWSGALREALHLPYRAARHCHLMPHDVLERRRFREYGFCTSHLRTFKGFLWNALERKDFIGSDGRYPTMAPDTTVMYPMLEMCRPGKIRFVPEVLYVYNDLNPLNEHKVDASLQDKVHAWVRQKPKYAVLQR
jgi:glycosyltransferase involved in cell wall biosynthesis